jgi:predicted nucleic acid-binding protein
MPVKIVDASGLGALLFGEPRAAEVANALSGATLVAPALLWFELASICLKKIKAHPQQLEQLLNAFDLVRRMAIATVAVDHGAAVRLAQRTGLTAYDASYLWLTLELKAELVTLDAKLRKAATHAGKPV